MAFWTRLRRTFRVMGKRLSSLWAADAPAPAPLPAIAPPPTRGALDVRSVDLGDVGGWTQRNYTHTRFSAIQDAIVSDTLLLRGGFLPEQLARQGGYTLEPASGSNLSERHAQVALEEVEKFIGSVSSPFGEGFEQIFYRCVGELARYSNFALELVWQGGTVRNISLLPWISMNLLVDTHGVPVRWVQFDYFLRRTLFELGEICHGVLNRQAGDRYGTPMLEPTAGDSGDLKAYRAIESMAGQQIQHLIFPTRLIKFGTEQYPETNDARLTKQKTLVEDMYREGYLIGSGRESLESDAPTPMDPVPLLNHFKQRVAQATGFSLVRLGEGSEINVATAEVLAAGEHQNQMAITMAAADCIRQGLFVPLLAARGLPAIFAPHLVPGEPDPVRRQKQGEHAVTLYEKGVITQDESRMANGYPPLTDDQQTLPRPKGPGTPGEEDSGDSEPEETREERQEERSK